MEKNFIKIANEKIAKQIIDLGFTYTKEKINNMEIYAFSYDEKLIKFLKSHYSGSDFFLNNKMHF